MKKLVFVNACIRGCQSRTLYIAKKLLAELEDRYEIAEIDLSDSSILPVTQNDYLSRGNDGLSAEDIKNGRLIAEADRIVIAAPFWDMSFPSVLKAFFEHISAPELTFVNTEDGNTKGICRAEKLLYITTRGMEIETDSPLDQGTSYLRALGWLWGFGEVYPVAAKGLDVNGGEEISLRIEKAIEYGLEICKEF